MLLGITDPMRDRPALENYMKWVKRWIPDAHMQPLSYKLDNARDLEHCQGLILTGGGDVHPRFYQQEDAIDVAKEVSESRDEFEFGIIKEALRHDMPVLGICRGVQIFNVAMGGSLIPDIESAGHPSHRRGNASERMHPVQVENGTLLHSVVRTDGGEINTSHHQAVANVGQGLRVTARSNDGIVEALEWETKAGHPFLLLVQWHPERMKDSESPFSRNIIERFVGETQRSTTV